MLILGVAQTHSSLLMLERQRMPGLSNGQVYTYPSKRWKKKRRQYLLNTCNSSSVNSSVFNSNRRKESGMFFMINICILIYCVFYL